MILDSKHGPIVAVIPTPPLLNLLRAVDAHRRSIGHPVPDALRELIADGITALAARNIESTSLANVGHPLSRSAPVPPSLFLTTTTVARLTGRSTRTVRRMAARGAYPGARRATNGWQIPAEAIHETNQKGAIAA